MDPFAIRVADRDLDDLADRLARTRWPAELPPGWDRGTDPVYLRRTAAVPGHEALYPDAPPGADGNALPAGRRIDAPVGVLRTAGYDPPRRWAERVYSDLRHWTLAPRGGHFLAMEEPDLLVEDLREFFRPLRTR